jgi:hypothetical protein
MKAHRDLVKCAVCCVEFDPVKSIGRWECRTHVARTQVFLDGRPAYPCCTLTGEDQTTAYNLIYTHLDVKELLGCVAADHVSVDAVVDPSQPRRPVDDLYLLSDVTHSNAFADIPPAAVIMKGTPWTYGALERSHGIGDTLAARLDLPRLVEDRVQTATSERALRDEALVTVERAYARPELYETSAENKRKRAEVLRQRSSWRTGGTTAEQRHFLETTQMMNADDFLVQWFTKIQKTEIAVDLCIVRAVAPRQDESFLRRLKSQREYIQSHGVLRH